MRYAKPVAISLCVLVAVVVAAVVRVGGCRTHKEYSYGPVMPHVGDEAVIRLSQVLPATLRLRGDWPFRPGDTIYRTLVIRCVETKGCACKFVVRSRKTKMRPYVVVVNYATNDIQKRTSVYDPNGHVIPRYAMRDGVPIPFHDFLAFDKSYLAVEWKDQELPGDLRAHLGRVDRGRRGYWNLALDVGPVSSSENEYGQSQFWRVGDWLWSSCSHNEYVGPPPRPLVSHRERLHMPRRTGKQWQGGSGYWKADVVEVNHGPRGP